MSLRVVTEKDEMSQAEFMRTRDELVKSITRKERLLAYTFGELSGGLYVGMLASVVYIMSIASPGTWRSIVAIALAVLFYGAHRLVRWRTQPRTEEKPNVKHSRSKQPTNRNRRQG